MAETKKISNKAHGLGVLSVICLIVGIITMLGSFTADFITQQAGTLLYGMFFILLAILFQLMKMTAGNNTKSE